MLNGFPWPVIDDHSKDPRNINYAPSAFVFVESAEKQEDQCKRYKRAVQHSKRKLSGPSINICKNSTNQKDNRNKDRVETGDEQEEADDNTIGFGSFHVWL